MIFFLSFLNDGMIKPRSEEETKGFQLKIGKKGAKKADDDDEDSDY